MASMSQGYEKRLNVLQTQNFQLEARLMQTEAKMRKVSDIKAVILPSTSND